VKQRFELLRLAIWAFDPVGGTSGTRKSEKGLTVMRVGRL